MHQVTRLENGLRIATAEMPHMTSVSLGFWVGVGGRHESEAEHGIAHFLEHLIFKGTRKRSARAISQEVEGVGGTLDAYTSEEHTCFFAKAPHHYFESLVDVLSDMVLHSVLAQEEVEKERCVIKEEVSMYADQPQQQVVEWLHQLLWPRHPLGRPITGTHQSINAIRRADLVAFHRHRYVANDLVITAAGKVDHDRVVRALRPSVARLRIGSRPPFRRVRSGQRQPRVYIHTKETEQTQLAIGLRVCSRHDRRRFPLYLLNALLGENSSSRLFQVVREDYGLVYSIYSSLTFFQDVGSLSILAGVENDQLGQAVKLIMRELVRLTERPPSAGELRLARDYVIGQIELSLENTENQMSWLGEQILGYDRLGDAEKVKERLAAVEPEQIQAAARDFIRPDRLSVALLSPKPAPKKIHRWLAF